MKTTISILAAMLFVGCTTEAVELPEGDGGCTCRTELEDLAGVVQNIGGYVGWLDSRLTALEQLHDVGDDDAGDVGDGEEAGTP